MNETPCRSRGALIVAGKQVGWLACEMEAHHELARLSDDGLFVEAGTPHRMTLEWADEGIADWPEWDDPDEAFDVEVPG